MNETSLKTWILWGVLLFALTLSADYFFLHLLFNHEKNTQSQIDETKKSEDFQDLQETPTQTAIPQTAETPQAPPSGDGNFLAALKECAPEIAAQTIATPEAFVEYLQKSIGPKKEDITLETYELTLADGSLRQLQVLKSDSSKSKEKRDLRFYSVNPNGNLEAVKLAETETIQSVLQQGKTTRHNVKSEIELRDGSHVLLEKHDNRVFEVQYTSQKSVLSCRYTQCECKAK